MASEYLLRWTLQNQPCTISINVWPPSQRRSISWCSNGASWFQFVITAYGSVSGLHWKEPCSFLYYFTLYLDTLIRSSYPPDYAVPTLFWLSSAEAGVSISTKKVDTFLTFKPLVPLSVTQHNQHIAKHFSTVKSSGGFKCQRCQQSYQGKLKSLRPR